MPVPQGFKVALLTSIVVSGVANAATTNVCQIVHEEGMSDPMPDPTMGARDPTRSPIRADVHPDGNVTFHFLHGNPPPVTINGLEPIPNPTTAIDRNLQQYLHKRAGSTYKRCMHEESLKVRHPHRHPLGEVK
jgi:hypothetical protein